MADIAGKGYHTTTTMAPEQKNNRKNPEKWTDRVDIFALGVMIYQLFRLHKHEPIEEHDDGRFPRVSYSLHAESGKLRKIPSVKRHFGDDGVEL